ncbi:MAG: J domain-containing protein [Syntrophobacteraceae bacterium]
MTRLSDKATPEDYRTLGLSPEAEPAKVKHAFRNLVKQWHPDRYHQRSALEQHQAEERFKAISLAYRRIVSSWDPEVKKSKVAEGAPGRASSSSEARPRPSAAERPDPSYREGKRSGRSRPTILRSAWRIAAACLRALVAGPKRAFWILAVLLVAVNLVPWERLSIPVAPLDSAQRQKTGQSSHHWPTLQDQPGEPSPDTRSPEEADRPRSLPSKKARRFPPGRLLPSKSEESSFSIGSTQEEVLRVQGTPHRTRGQTWIYGLSDVSFKDGRVVRYNNFGGELRVHLAPARVSQAASRQWFTLGSTPDEVLSIQGTPTRVEGTKWFYGFSEVSFKNGRVDGFDNYFGALKVKMLPASYALQDSSGSTFTVGSTMDEVLVVQGTPTSIRGNVWFYQFSNVLFRNGRVQNAVDTAGVLRFVLPDENPQRK